MDPVHLAATVAALAAGGAGAVWIVRGVIRGARRLGHALDDVLGEPARPGVLARPGIVARLGAIEAELRPNHGSSLRDAVDRVERDLADHITNHNELRS